jgi:type IX secretion system PorP/SprF family membrane protein
MVGSKDYLSVDLNGAFVGKSNAFVLTGNTRLSRYASGYFGNPNIREFNNFGVGGSIFMDNKEPSKNIGAAVTGSFQIPLNMRKLSFLSFGISVKGVYNTLDTSSAESGSSSKKSFYPDLDFGIYYYGTNFFAGLSSTNLLRKDHSAGMIAEIPVTRQYYFTAGYKILLSKSLNIVLEPSVFVNVSDSTFSDITENINPILKLYLEDFCLGTYFISNGKISFFFQYKYSKFYVGAFFELPKKSPYFKRTPLVEFTAGINLQIDKSRYSRHSHW